MLALSMGGMPPMDSEGGAPGLASDARAPGGMACGGMAGGGYADAVVSRRIFLAGAPRDRLSSGAGGAAPKTAGAGMAIGGGGGANSMLSMLSTGGLAYWPVTSSNSLPAPSRARASSRRGM